jgi:hypothetical protein
VAASPGGRNEDGGCPLPCALQCNTQSDDDLQNTNASANTRYLPRTILSLTTHNSATTSLTLVVDLSLIEVGYLSGVLVLVGGSAIRAAARTRGRPP